MFDDDDDDDGDDDDDDDDDDGEEGGCGFQNPPLQHHPHHHLRECGVCTVVSVTVSVSADVTPKKEANLCSEPTCPKEP